MHRRALAALSMMVVGSLLSGCGGGDGGVLHSGDSVVLVGADVLGPTVGVGFGGSVAMVGDCLGVEGDGAVATVIWPHGTKIASDDPLTIDVPGLGRVSVGDQVAGGDDVNVDRLPKGNDAIPSGCPTEQVVAFYPNH
jgi:hypothetical protein